MHFRPSLLFDCRLRHRRILYLRLEHQILSDQGLNPFVHYALPEAVMRLRQGFGRLIRSSSDKGFFIILDRRIDTKSYGKQFLTSLPDVPVKKVPLQVMVNELENCYNRLV